ncbi:hypothetical protein [Actinacidiphila soli]|uniref:hypothetical protein n=1 Tax=Actinacidiphila soli TaxID=2487275 RepID=UPI000FCCC505|nr:hypothetical protein [Actinacidiphila soli]
MSRLIVDTAAWSWLDDTGFGPVAFLLLVPTDGEAVAAALGLADPGARLSDIGGRITVLHPGRIGVRLDGASHAMELAVGERWSAFVDAGGPAAILVGLEPLARGADRDAVEAYVAATTLSARLRLGVSRRHVATP